MQNCTVDSQGHSWVIGPDEASLIPSTDAVTVLMGLAVQRVSTGTNPLVSSVSGTLTSELNNTMIVCRDGVQQIAHKRQEASVMVFGK